MNQMSWSSEFYFKETDSHLFIKSHNIPEKYDISQQKYDDSLDELNSLLLKTSKCFEDNEQLLWDQLTFSLIPDGKFTVDFLYDRISDDGGQVKRELIFSKKMEINLMVFN